jgi:hypothetical protein
MTPKEEEEEEEEKEKEKKKEENKKKKRRKRRRRSSPFYIIKPLIPHNSPKLHMPTAEYCNQNLCQSVNESRKLTHLANLLYGARFEFPPNSELDWIELTEKRFHCPMNIHSYYRLLVH